MKEPFILFNKYVKVNEKNCSLYIDFLSWRRWISENKSATWNPIVSRNWEGLLLIFFVVLWVCCLVYKEILYIIQTELSSFSRFLFLVCCCIFTLYTIQSLILFVFFLHSAIVFLLWQIFLKKSFFFFVINFDLRNDSLKKCGFLSFVLRWCFCQKYFFFWRWEVNYLS